MFCSIYEIGRQQINCISYLDDFIVVLSTVISNTVLVVLYVVMDKN